VLAIIIFAVAAAIAVVQATGSDTTSESQAAQQTATGQSTQIQGQQAAVLSESGEETGGQSTLVQVQQETTQQAQSSDEAALQEAEQESNQAQSVVQQQSDQEQASATAAEDNPLRGFSRPILGACISEFENHLPSATREYRNHGIHEGLDFYEWASCTRIDYATEILAAKGGVVIRADLDYVEITPADWQRFSDANWEGEDILNELRGRQVWIDHGRGIVTRYAHLSAIADGIAVGVEVQQGQVIGYPGESGQQEVYANPGTDIHLHFEIRVGSGWLGQGESPLAARTLYLQAFGLAQ
jgi:murein DD-endopeptidase MepM/ murein hydrolase activator NlpD